MGMYQPYEKSEPFSGESRKAMEFAAMTLSAAGFRIRENSETLLRAEASRTTDWNRCQALLKNVVAIELRSGGSMLTARAELADYPILNKTISGIVGALFLGGFYYYVNHGSRPIPAEFKTVIYIFAGVYLLIAVLTTLTGTSAFRKFAGYSVDSFLKNVVIAAGGSGGGS